MMRTGPNFADPEYEPTEGELAELMHEAFSGIREARIGDLRRPATGGS